eukprot:gene14237-4187_t
MAVGTLLQEQSPDGINPIDKLLKTLELVTQSPVSFSGPMNDHRDREKINVFIQDLEHISYEVACDEYSLRVPFSATADSIIHALNHNGARLLNGIKTYKLCERKKADLRRRNIHAMADRNWREQNRDTFGDKFMHALNGLEDCQELLQTALPKGT